jgi:CIC family chloride channel protein
VTAAAARRYLLGFGPLFPVPAHPLQIGPEGLLSCVLVGVLAGALSALLTGAVYASEDAFAKLPIHWMWWPVLGGLAIGVGGLIFPEALGVGYDMIGNMLQHELPVRMLAGILLVKSAMWAISLGSGTSGGVLAPLLMMGGAMGAVLAPVLPAEGLGFWPLIGMGAILGGTMRSPFTGVVFMLELTHDVNMILPLLTAVLVAHGFTVLVLKRSILTEKISRRGYHLSREYSSDPLEILFVREVMHSDVMQTDVGPISETVVAYPDEPLRAVVYRMAETGKTLLPVLDPADGHKFVGLVSLNDLLHARVRSHEEEHKRERVLRFRMPTGV